MNDNDVMPSNHRAVARGLGRNRNVLGHFAFGAAAARTAQHVIDGAKFVKSQLFYEMEEGNPQLATTLASNLGSDLGKLEAQAEEMVQTVDRKGFSLTTSKGKIVPGKMLRKAAKPRRAITGVIDVARPPAQVGQDNVDNAPSQPLLSNFDVVLLFSQTSVAMTAGTPYRPYSPTSISNLRAAWGEAIYGGFDDITALSYARDSNSNIGYIIPVQGGVYDVTYSVLLQTNTTSAFNVAIGPDLTNWYRSGTGWQGSPAQYGPFCFDYAYNSSSLIVPASSVQNLSWGNAETNGGNAVQSKIEATFRFVCVGGANSTGGDLTISSVSGSLPGVGQAWWIPFPILYPQSSQASMTICGLGTRICVRQVGAPFSYYLNNGNFAPRPLRLTDQNYGGKLEAVLKRASFGGENLNDLNPKPPMDAGLELPIESLDLSRGASPSPSEVLDIMLSECDPSDERQCKAYCVCMDEVALKTHRKLAGQQPPLSGDEFFDAFVKDLHRKAQRRFIIRYGDCYVSSNREGEPCYEQEKRMVRALWAEAEGSYLPHLLK